MFEKNFKFCIFILLYLEELKNEITKTGHLQCHITLVPENEIERSLLKIVDEKDKVDKEYTFEVQYQRAITCKFGFKAHLTSLYIDVYPAKCYVGYIIEGGSMGNH